MSTAFAQLLQAMVAPLTAAPPLAGGRVHANRLRPIAAGGASAIVSCDTVAHPTNRISIVPAVAVAVRDLGF